jgi:hypothetical protein
VRRRTLNGQDWLPDHIQIGWLLRICITTSKIHFWNFLVDPTAVVHLP